MFGKESFFFKFRYNLHTINFTHFSVQFLSFDKCMQMCNTTIIKMWSNFFTPKVPYKVPFC